MSIAQAPDETILLQRNSREFIRYNATFTENLGTYVKPSSERFAIKRLVDASTIKTPEFEEFIQRKYPEFLEQVQSKPIATSATFVSTGNLSSSARKTFTTLLTGKPPNRKEDADFAVSPRPTPTPLLPPSKLQEEPSEAEQVEELRQGISGMSLRVPTSPLSKTKAAKVVAPQSNVNVDVDLAINAVKKSEVQKVQGEIIKVAKEGAEDDADTVPSSIQVEEGSSIKGLDSKQETPKTVLSELDEEDKYLNIVKSRERTAVLAGALGNQGLADQTADTFVPVVESVVPVVASVSLETEGSVDVGVDTAAAEIELPQVPEGEPDIGAGVAAVDPLAPVDSVEAPSEVPTTVPTIPSSNKPEHHLSSVLFYFDSTTSPDWDLELEKNIFDTDLSVDYMVDAMDMIIDKYGPDIGVFSRDSETKNEYHVIQQLLFSRMRNMQRGSRSKQAVVPISSLVSFANKLQTGPRFPSVAPAVGPPGPALVTPAGPIDPNAGGSGQVQTPIVASASVPIAQNQAIEKLVDAYRSAPFDRWGKPVINQAIVDQTKVKHFNIIGPGSAIDPMQMFVPGVLDAGLKISSKKKCKTISFSA